MKRRTRWIVAVIVAVPVLLIGAYFVALAAFKPDPTKLTAWRSDLDGALAEASRTNKLVVVKAGSEH